MEYTKGEWKVEVLGQGMWEILSGEYLVASSGCPESIKEKNESIGNAHLIAAAPRMVDTLLMVREELVFGGDWETARNKIDEVLIGKPKVRGQRNNISPEERQRRSEFMKEIHRRRQENDPTNSWYGQRKG